MKLRFQAHRLICLLAIPLLCPAATLDLRPHGDEATPLRNPDKGWYHHYPDNHINKYKIARDSDLLEFPGMDHLYIRLAWAYLQPEKDRFDWTIVDELIEKWTKHGLGIAFRISCKETSTDRPEQQFATPKWVMEGGAKGGHYRMGKAAGPEAPWEPEFDDPVFLRELERFLAAFAARYDGKAWLRYVDIGSIGDWGEGHTWAGSRIEYNFAQRKPHIDLHLKYFKKSLLVISDDFVFGVAPAERQKLHQYVVEHGISYRDDSILVDGYFGGHSATATVRSPEFFANTYLLRPTVLELEHYSAVKRAGNWTAAPNSSIAKHGGGRTGADMLRQALGLLHATYIGYHGDAADWLKDNPQLSNELLNRCGYWFFLQEIELPEVIRPAQNTLTMTWENRGVAPAYEPYELVMRLEAARSFAITVDAGNRKWLPSASPGQKTWRESYLLNVPQTLEAGTYELKLKLRSAVTGQDVLLALNPKLLDKANFYAVGKVKVGR